LTISGHYVTEHRDEILDLIRDTINGLEHENRREPSFRIAESPSGSIEVTFTNAQLARDIGQILHQKYWGELEVQVEDGGESVRVMWWR
jgi:hypothetical protein